MQGLKVLATIVDETARLDTKFFKVTGALNYRSKSLDQGVC